MTILSFFDYFYPGYKSGGPAKSSLGFAEWLSDDYSIMILTRNHDFGETTPYSSILENKWIKKSNFSVIYLSSLYFYYYIFFKLKKEKFNVYYFNSVFSFKFSILPLLLIKLHILPRRNIVLAPRGELANSALSLKSRKKVFYLKLFKKISKNLNIHYQATSKHEFADIVTQLNSNTNIFLVNNLRPKSEKPSFTSSIKKENELLICCISRLSPVKNLEFAITLLNNLNVNITFDIYGSFEDIEYVNKLRDLIKNEKVKLKGQISPEKVIDLIKNYDLFFLPTLGENFGHSILESLIASRPVLISDKTPWRNLKVLKAGYDIPLENKNDFINTIIYFLEMNQSEHNLYCEGAYNLSEDYFSSINLSDYHKLFTFVKN